VTGLVQAVLLFGCAGTWRWLWAWAYIAIWLTAIIVNGAILLRTSPETIAERGRPQRMQGWDRLLSGLGSVLSYVALPLIAVLDVRFRWTAPLAAAWHLSGAALCVAGSGLATWAVISNAFFSTVVRIQNERGHSVCRDGPYRFVRHPGYSGFILTLLAVPILLGSLVALVPAFLGVLCLVARTLGEEKMLLAELAGYPEYVLEVRYRLLPGIW